MQLRTKQSVIFLAGTGALLIAVLAVIIASRPQIAYAQNPGPSVRIDLNSYNGNLSRGQPFATYIFENFQSITCDKSVGGPHHTLFDDVCYHRHRNI